MPLASQFRTNPVCASRGVASSSSALRSLPPARSAIRPVTRSLSYPFHDRRPTSVEPA